MRSAGSAQSRAILSMTGPGGARSTSSTNAARSKRSAYPSSSNSGSRRAIARPGPDASARNAPLPSPCSRLQPAYWLARQAMHRVGAVHVHVSDAADLAIARRQCDRAQPAHADLGDTPPRFQAAARGDARVHERRAALARRDAESERIRRDEELRDARRRERVDAHLRHRLAQRRGHGVRLMRPRATRRRSSARRARAPGGCAPRFRAPPDRCSQPRRRPTGPGHRPRWCSPAQGRSRHQLGKVAWSGIVTGWRA